MLEYGKINKDYCDHHANLYGISHPEHFVPSLHPSWGIRHIPEGKLRLIVGKIPTGGTVVEVGCGTGHDIIGFARLGFRVRGFDLVKNMLETIPKGYGVSFAQALAEAPPIDDCSADAVYSDHGAFDFSHAEQLLAEARRVLRPGGILVICTYSSSATICYDEATKQTSDYLRRSYKETRVQPDGSVVVLTIQSRSGYRWP